MNHISEIKKILDRYFEGMSSDADEQQLCEYFTSNEVTEELQAYRSLFAYISRAKEIPVEACSVISLKPHGRAKIWLFIAGVAASIILVAVFLNEQQPAATNNCTGTYVMVNGVCYTDVSLVSKYATETIDQVTRPIGDNAAVNALDFLDEPHQFIQ
jgi:hypothetical protein